MRALILAAGVLFAAVHPAAALVEEDHPAFTQDDGPAAVNAVLAQAKARRLMLVGYSLGGLVAYSLMEGPLAPKIAAAVTLAGAGTMSGGTGFEQALRRFFGIIGLAFGPAFPSGTPFPIGFFLHKTLGGNDAAWAVLSRKLCSPLGQPFWNEDNMTPERVEALLRPAPARRPAAFLALKAF